MQIPRKYIENYSNTLNVVSEQARRKLADALSQIDYTQDVATIRNAVIAVMQPACGASANVAAQLAADFYDGLRERFDVVDDFEAEPQSLRNPDATSGAVRAFAQDLVEEKPLDDFVGKCVDRIDYETRRAANECVAYNAKKDPKKPRWARVPAGAETCMWCIMLASRGFVYSSEEAASHSHAHCDCRIVPSWDKKNPAVQGYDPDLYYDMWKNPEKYKNDETIKQASSITFNLDGVKNSSGTKDSINSLAAEYKTNLETVQPMAIVKKAEKGEVDIPTGTVMQLLSGDDQTVAHEFAHTMWAQKRLDEYRIDGSADFAKELRKIWKRYRNEALYEGEIISSYAGTSIDEFMAEAFSAYKTGKTADKFGVGKDSVYVRQVGKLIDKYFKR